MKLHLHDIRPCEPGDKHGPRGVTHVGDIEIDFVHEVEEWVASIGPFDLDTVYFIECPDLGREWKRNRSTGKFFEEARVLN